MPPAQSHEATAHAQRRALEKEIMLDAQGEDPDARGIAATAGEAGSELLD